MPLISVNLRDPGGFASHMSNVTQQVGKSLKESTHSDLLIICRSGPGIKCHQSLLEPLSPLMSSLFQQHNCCNCSSSSCGRREIVQVHLPDIRRRTMELLLDVVYTGNGQCRRKSIFEEVKDLMSLLDIKIPGDFIIEDPTGHFETPTASNASATQIKKHYSVSEVGSLKHANPAQSDKDKNPQYLLLQMIQGLMPLEDDKILECNYPGCEGHVNAENVTSHFQTHFKEYEKQIQTCQVNRNQGKQSPVLFKCGACDKNFKFRMALEHHKKKHHKVDSSMVQEMPKTRTGSEKFKDKTNIDQEVKENRVRKKEHLKGKSKMSEHNNELQVSDVDNNMDASEQEENDNVDIDEVNKVRISDDGTIKLLNHIEEFICGHCRKIFSSRSQLKIHVGMIHYLTKLQKIYTGTVCGICELVVTSNQALCKHVCCMHDSVLKYLLGKDGLTLPPRKKKRKEDIQPTKKQNKVLEEKEFETQKRESRVKKEDDESKVKKEDDESKVKKEDDESKYLNNSTLPFESLECQICSKSYCNKRTLQVHYTSVHYYTDILKQYGKENSPFNKCPICSITLPQPPGNKTLKMVQQYHLATKHVDVLFDYLIKDNIKLTPSQPLVTLMTKSALPTEDRKIDKEEKVIETCFKETKSKKEEVESNAVINNINSSDYKRTECKLCFKSFKTLNSLRIHYTSVHYYTSILKLSGKEDTPVSKCPLCEIDILVPTTHKVNLKKNQQCHITTKHWDTVTELMMKDNIELMYKPDTKYAQNAEDSPSFSLGEHGYNIKKVRVDIKKGEGFFPKVKENKSMKRIFLKRKKPSMSPHNDREDTPPAKRRREVEIPKLPLQQLMHCFLCGIDFNGKTPIDLLLHYSQEHYRLELERNHVERSDAEWSRSHCCPKCGKKIEQQNDFIKHIGVDHRGVEEYIPEKYRLPSNSVESPPTFPCPVSGCGGDKETKRSLLVHLLIVHYQKEMERDFGTNFKTLSGVKNCPICNMVLLDNYVGYMKHIAVEHEYVLKFVNQTKIISEVETGDNLNVNSIENTVKSVLVDRINVSPLTINNIEGNHESIEKNEDKKKYKEGEDNKTKADNVPSSVELTQIASSETDRDTIQPVSHSPRLASGQLVIRAIWDSDSD